MPSLGLLLDIFFVSEGSLQQTAPVRGEQREPNGFNQLNSHGLPLFTSAFFAQCSGVASWRGSLERTWLASTSRMAWAHLVKATR